MKSGFLFPLLLAFQFMVGFSQNSTQECSSSPRVSQKTQLFNKHSENNHFSTLKIENGKIWLNGNLIPNDALPEGLKSIHEGYFLQTTVFGATDFQFSFQGIEYLLEEGKILEKSFRAAIPEHVDHEKNTEVFFSDLKRNNPEIFSGLYNEALVHDQLRRLSINYRGAEEMDKSNIRIQLREVLEILFELNIENQQSEIVQMEKDLAIIKRELEFRRKNKEKIVENKLSEIIR